MNYVDEARLFDNYFQHNLDEWSTYCFCKNTIEDTSSALLNYEKKGLGKDYDEKYLRLYGMLQAVFLQQDAIEQLYNLFIRSKLSNKGSNWTKTRDIRNMSVGHPIEYKRKGIIKRTSISMVTISDKGFQLVVWDKQTQKRKFMDVDLRKIYEGYKKEAIKALETIYLKLPQFS